MFVVAVNTVVNVPALGAYNQLQYLVIIWLKENKTLYVQSWRMVKNECRPSSETPKQAQKFPFTLIFICKVKQTEVMLFKYTYSENWTHRKYCTLRIINYYLITCTTVAWTEKYSVMMKLSIIVDN